LIERPIQSFESFSGDAGEVSGSRVCRFSISIGVPDRITLLKHTRQAVAVVGSHHAFMTTEAMNENALPPFSSKFPFLCSSLQLVILCFHFMLPALFKGEREENLNLSSFYVSFKHLKKLEFASLHGEKCVS